LTSWKPTRSAAVAYEDHQIRVYTDATWTPVTGTPDGWVGLLDAVIYADGTGDARITTSWGHSKLSHVRGPDGTKYDVRLLATGPAA